MRMTIKTATGIKGLLAMISPSPTLAATIYGWANVGLIGSLIIGAASTVLIVWMGDIKEDALKRDVAAAGLVAARANESAAKANQLAEHERLERLRLEASLAPRILTAAQSLTIAAALRGKILVKVHVQSDPGDVEAYPFAQQILKALKSAGVDAEYQPWPSTFMWLNEPGVFVVTAGVVDGKQTALIFEALNTAGLNVDEVRRPDDMSPKPPNPGWVSVLVWKQR